MRSRIFLSASLALAAMTLSIACTREATPGDTSKLSPGVTNRDLAANRDNTANRDGAANQYGTANRDNAAKPGNTSATQGWGTSPAAPRVYSVTLPAGTALVVRTTSAMSTKSQQSGESFTAHLEQPMLLNGTEVVPKGARVEGTIVESDDGGRVKGLAVLAVKLNRLQGASGQMVELSTNNLSVQAQPTKKKDAAKVGIGSGVGAAIGAIAGGAKGAVIGAAAGAGAGTGAVLATHGDAAVIPSESVLRFTLTSPVTLPG